MERRDLDQYDLPDSPGVYFFKKGRKILYVGKAASLRSRVRSYFSTRLGEGRSPAIVGMVEEANKLAWTETGSVLEALILEANLIKKHEPPYNVDQKDNKSWNYLVITRERVPRVLVIRGRELAAGKGAPPIRHIFGPYPHGGALREALKIVRKILPFHDSPITDKPCFSSQIGLCPGICAGRVNTEEYGRAISRIRLLFEGKTGTLLRSLNADMKKAAKEERFEDAERLRRQTEALLHIRDVSLIKDEYRSAHGGALRNGTYRIEAYDVAHTAGSETVAVMTVVEDGETTRGEYRKFRVRSAGNDDTKALRESLARRLAHPEWRMPRLIVVDGGKGQVNAAKRVLESAGVAIPIVGVVKNAAHKPERLIGDAKAISEHEGAILLANSEAHRFAISWHRKSRERKTLTN